MHLKTKTFIAKLFAMNYLSLLTNICLQKIIKNQSNGYTFIFWSNNTFIIGIFICLTKDFFVNEEPNIKLYRVHCKNKNSRREFAITHVIKGSVITAIVK